MTVYLHMPQGDRRDGHFILAGLNALRLIRDQLSAYPGVRVVAAPATADVDVQIVDIVPPQAGGGDSGQYILVVRMTRKGERLDFVCSDGPGSLSAERQAARRIRNWLAGEHFMSIARPTLTANLHPAA
jgi:hypothetical protein